MKESPDLTRILKLIKQGDHEAESQLIPLTYSELRRIAAQMMANEREGHTLQATALVHEAYIRLVGPNGEQTLWNNRGHFFSAAAEAMRRILIENARRKMAAKRGAGADHTGWDDSRIVTDTPPEELLKIDDALVALEQEDPEWAMVVKLRYFAGMTVPETAEALQVSPRKVNRQWEGARAWLKIYISKLE